MKRRELAAWILVVLAVALNAYLLAEQQPTWTLINTKQGAVRMDLKTGYTQWLRGSSWREVDQFYYAPQSPPPTYVNTSPPPQPSQAFDPDKFLETSQPQPPTYSAEQYEFAATQLEADGNYALAGTARAEAARLRETASKP